MKDGVKNMYALKKLSGLEQKLYFLLEAEDRKIVTAQEAMKLLKIPKLQCYGVLRKMEQKGALGKVKANLYVRIPAHIVHDRGNYAEDPVIVAAHLAGPADSVKLEINFLERVPVAGTVSKRFGHVFDLPPFKVKTYSLEEITAMKTKAMAERLYPRDIHDIFHASQMRMRKSLLRKLIMFYIVLAKREPRLDTLLRRIEKYDEKEFVRALGPFLRMTQAARVELRDMKKHVEEFYKKLFILNRDDEAFLKSCESGNPDVRLLFRGMHVNQELRAHPGLLFALGQK